MKDIKRQLDSLRRQIRKLFPSHKGRIAVHVIEGYSPETFDALEITVYGCKTYAEGTELLRSIGIGEREKQIIDDDKPWVSVKGNIGADEVSAYCDGLPPSCRIETFVERIPKQQTVDTGEFVEVERSKIVCGNQAA